MSKITLGSCWHSYILAPKVAKLFKMSVQEPENRTVRKGCGHRMRDARCGERDCSLLRSLNRTALLREYSVFSCDKDILGTLREDTKVVRKPI